MEAWRNSWRVGFAPGLSTAGLRALLKACREDNPCLLQGATSSPPPMKCVTDWPVEAACPVGFAGWQGDGLGTIGEVEDFWARQCSEADERLKEPAACRYFHNWVDDTPRDVMRRELAFEIELELTRRGEAA